MKKKLAIIILLAFMVVGYAAVNTTLNINGNASIAFNDGDFNVYFSKTVLDDVDVTNSILSADKKTFTYRTSPLYNVGDKSIVDFELTNTSTQYDANVRISCQKPSDPIGTETDFKRDPEFLSVKARSTTAGKITVELIQKGTDTEYFQDDLLCYFDVYAVERTEEENGEILPRGYYLYGFLERNGIALSERDIVIYSDHAYYGKTDRRGLLFIDDIPYGNYEIYVIPKGVNNFKDMSKEDLENIADAKATLDLDASKISFSDSLYNLDDCRIAWGEPSTYKVIFDFGEGTDENFESIVLEDHKIGTLPNANHPTLALVGWYYNGDIVNSEDVIKSETITLQAQYGSGVAKVNSSVFRTLNDAFNYISDDSATIELLSDTALEDNITNEKDVILNLNGLNVDFKDYTINNLGTLSINSGSIKASGEDVLINRGTLNIKDNVEITHSNTSISANTCRVFYNEKGAITNLNSVNVSSNCVTNNDNNFLLFNRGNLNVDDSTFKTIDGRFLYSDELSSTILNNSNVDSNYPSNTSINSNFAIFGDVTIDGGKYLLSSSNATDTGLFILNRTGKLNLKSGTFDASNGNGNVAYGSGDTTIDIGSSGKNIYFVGNATNTYVINAQGMINLNDGNIYANNGHLIISTREITIGSDSAFPVIEGASGYELIELRGATGKINNANIKTDGYVGLIIRDESTLDIDNIVYSHSSTSNGVQPIIVENSNLNIYDGSFNIGTDNSAAVGLISGQGTSNIKLYGGTYDGKTAQGNVFVTDSETNTLIDAGNKDIKFIGNATNNYIISTTGQLDIRSGNILADNGYLIGASGNVTIGSDTTTPVMKSAKGFGLLDVRSTGTINNVEMYSYDSNMFVVYDGATLDINNANIIAESTLSSYVSQPIQVLGTLNIHNGNYKTSDENTYLNGLIYVVSGGTLNLYAGTFDATTANANFIASATGTTINFGKENSNINMIGPSNSSSLVYSQGTTNILDGTLDISNQLFMIDSGELYVGSATKKPTINSTNAYLFYILGNTTVANASINVQDHMVAVVQSGATLTIDNGDIIQKTNTIANRAIMLYGNMIMNGGTIKNNENSSSYGIASITQTGSLTMNGGTLDGRNANANPIMIDNASSSIIINAGEILGRSDNPVIALSAGTLTMSGGSVINEGNGYTIYNQGGTATQTGGTSAKNYNVN